MSNLKLFIRELPGVHFVEGGFNWITIREDTLLQALQKMDYNNFLAELDEAEDEFLKQEFEELEADYWVEKYKHDL